MNSIESVHWILLIQTTTATTKSEKENLFKCLDLTGNYFSFFCLLEHKMKEEEKEKEKDKKSYYLSVNRLGLGWTGMLRAIRYDMNDEKRVTHALMLNQFSRYLWI